MKKELNEIVNRESGKIAIVMGMGPSLNPYIEQIKELSQDNNYVIIGCNDVDVLEINIDYWVFANSEATIKKMHPRLNKQNAMVVYADSVDLTPRNKVDKLLNVTYVPYDQRHFNSRPCGGGRCCSTIIQGRKTIQEEFVSFTKCDKLNTSSDTVAIPMLYLAVLLGCKDIYVTGVDLDYSKGYVNNYHYVEKATIPHILQIQPRILDTIKYIRDGAKNIDINMYCMDSHLPISEVLEHKSL